MARNVAIVLVVLCLVGEARGQTQAPADQEIAQAIAKGVEFLKEAQGDSGEWRYPEQPQHSLGMTALAGLALLENGIARDARSLSKAREIVATLARESNQTYDLALAILFLARCQQTRTGQRRLADSVAGATAGAWRPWRDLGLFGSPGRGGADIGIAEARGAAAAAGRRESIAISAAAATTPTRSSRCWVSGRPAGTGLIRTQVSNRSTGIFVRPSLRDGRWGYKPNMQGSEAMSCAGLMGLAIAASRPSLAERQTARARGAALAADPAFQAALRAVGQDARRAGKHSDIYYLWSLERVCVALGLRSLDGFDWYAHGARVLLDRQESDGGWPHDHWGRLPSTRAGASFPAKGQSRVRDRSRAAVAWSECRGSRGCDGRKGDRAGRPGRPRPRRHPAHRCKTAAARWC